MTPDSVISRNRSLPSRVRSPTPANTETPPKFLATRVIISWMSTVLPTPAPPNRPILPPLTYGVSRSRTLMPVSRISVRGSSWSKAAASRWIAQRSVIFSDAVGTSSDSPRTLNTWPLVTSPTGTEIGPPGVGHGRRRAPGRRSGCMEIARTMLSPRCWATSRVSVLVSLAQRDVDVQRVVDVGHLVGGELHVHDRADDPGDPAGALAGGVRRPAVVFSTVAVMMTLTHSLRSSRPARWRRRRSR